MKRTETLTHPTRVGTDTIVIDDTEKPASPSAAQPSPSPHASVSLHGADVSPLLVRRIISLPWQEQLTIVMLFLLSSAIVFFCCASAQADEVDKRFLRGVFGLSSVAYLTWSLASIFGFLSHTFVAPFSISTTSEQQLKAAAEFSVYMIVVFVCQCTTLFGRTEKEYSKDLFCSLMMLLFTGAVLTLRRIPAPVPRKTNVPTREVAAVVLEREEVELGDAAKTKDHPAPHTQEESRPHSSADPQTAVLVAPAQEESNRPKTTNPTVYHIAPLCREQTTEWRGWMQVLFLYYHYFHATNVYNAARLCVSAYVWMTGYGNFFFYTRRKDFGLLRFCHTMWRLNFLVFCLCCVLRNQLMLYYICPMHTLFTVCVYAGLYFRQDMHSSTRGVVIKLCVLAAVSALFFDLGGVSTALFRAVWWPLTWLLRYDSPVADTTHPLAEWQYRTGLDHFVWIAGMGFAQFQPTFDASLKRLDAMTPLRGRAIKAAVALATVAVLAVYAKLVYFRDRPNYNKLHPYTSFIPLTLYLVLRNISQRSRMYYSHLLYYLGGVTLETYLLQFHVWMSMVTVNGPPWHLLVVFPGFPLVNFVIFTWILVAMSERLFALTQVLEGIVLPDKVTNDVTLKNMGFAVLLIGVSAVLLWPGTQYLTRPPVGSKV